MTREEAKNILTGILHTDGAYMDYLDSEDVEAIKFLANDERPQWNPIKYRPMTEEEVLEMEERWDIELTIEERVCFDCSMPEDNQEILVCTKWGHIYIDRCELEIDSGYGLETNGDWDGIVAWMPLPDPYNAESEEP